MSEYVKKPVTYKAIQFDGNNYKQVLYFLEETDAYGYLDQYNPYLTFPNKKGQYIDHYLDKGDWIVVSSKGKLKVMTDTIFQKKYARAAQ